MKVNYMYSDTYRSTEIDTGKIELVIDPDDLSKIEIYMLDDDHERIEGGTFDMQAFMACVLDFYNTNF